MGTTTETPARERILGAAYEVVRERGTVAMTLEAVAEAAAVSKGGLLYHFASKDDLLRAMVERLIRDYDDAESAERDADPNPVGRSARAYVRAGTQSLRDSDVWLALVAALGEGPSMIEPWREHCAGWTAVDRRENVDLVDAVVARLAADGLWLADVLGVHAFDPRLRTRVVERLQELTERQS
jgi:AcrR family transcriptional regulator